VNVAPAVPGIVVLLVLLAPDTNELALLVEVTIEPHPRCLQRFDLLRE
jgi:hypothetical protein